MSKKEKNLEKLQTLLVVAEMDSNYKIVAHEKTNTFSISTKTEFWSSSLMKPDLLEMYLTGIIAGNSGMFRFN